MARSKQGFIVVEAPRIGTGELTKVVRSPLAPPSGGSWYRPEPLLEIFSYIDDRKFTFVLLFQ